MSHSRVFQLETCKKSEYEDNNISVLEEYSLEHNNFPDPNWIDYWCDSEDAPINDFHWLCTALPEGVFEVNDKELSLTLIKKPEDYVRDFFSKVREEAEKLSSEEYLNHKCDTWLLTKILRNNDCEFLVYQEEDTYPIYLHTWLLGLAKYGEVGKTYYLGGVLDYHY